ncbi:transposase [Microbulbifer magnicolonia]|uniref:transposase n=1 Tax=Microbulbifer magnicolonia TaxID=3109744 RepID=UPI002B413B9F|nr:transposase [Microbulbifer sp. GG15]
MARLPRFVIPGQPQHIIQRGNNRQEIFCEEDDYRFYLEKLEEAAEKFQCDVHAYVLMTNHVHLLVTPHTETGIGKMLQSLGRYYVQYFNYRYQRTGTLWEGRYRATLIDSEQYLFTCMRYIELNPVRASMVGHPSEYPWSSYRSNGAGVPASLISSHGEYRRLGRTEAERQSAYRQLVRARIPDKTLDEIRSATNKAWVLGSDRFRERIARQLNRRVAPAVRGGDRKSKAYRDNVEFNRV